MSIHFPTEGSLSDDDMLDLVCSVAFELKLELDSVMMWTSKFASLWDDSSTPCSCALSSLILMRSCSSAMIFVFSGSAGMSRA